MAQASPIRVMREVNDEEGLILIIPFFEKNGGISNYNFDY
jgi:hypothetical protein